MNARTVGGSRALWSALLVGLFLAIAPAVAQAAPKGALFFGSTSANPALGGTFNVQKDIAVYDGGDANPANDKVFVADDANHRIQRFSATGVFERAWGRDVIQGGKPGDLGDAFEVCTVAADCKAGSFGTTADAPAGEMDNPQGVAVNQATGHVYVRDRDNRRVQEFDGDGGFVRAWGWDVITSGAPGDLGVTFEVCAVATDCKQGVTGVNGGQFATTTTNGAGIAVHPVSGDVFVADPQNRRLQQFQANGSFVRLWGWDVVVAGQAGDVGTNAFEICAATTAGTCKAGATASPASSNGQFGTGQPLHVAVGSSGVVSASDSTAINAFSCARVMRFDSTQALPAGLPQAALDCPPLTSTSGGTTGLEVDRDDNHLYVMRGSGPVAGVEQVDVLGAFVARHLAGSGLNTGSTPGLGLNSATGDLYVSTNTGGNRILSATEAGAVPATVAIGSPMDVSAHALTVNGTVNPSGTSGIPASYRFEYSKNGVIWTPAGTDASVGDGASAVPVSKAITGLEANTFYRARLVATKPLGNLPVVSAEITFLTDAVAPEVDTGAVQHRTATSAQLRALINPNNLPTTYRFEYGKTTSYGSSVPIPAGSAGAAGAERQVVEKAGGLVSSTTYHYRVVATNAEGTSVGADRTFTTRPAATGQSPDPCSNAELRTGYSAELPDCRAYELVTSPDKNNRRFGFVGSDQVDESVYANAQTPSPDGESMFLRSFAAILDPDAGSGFPAKDGYEVRTRGSDGWTGRAVFNNPAVGGGAIPNTADTGHSANFDVSTWWTKTVMFASGSHLGTRVVGSTAGVDGSGWFDWVPNGLPSDQEDSALITDDGGRMVRWSAGTGGDYRGLLGPADPSLAQNAGTKTIYSQTPAGSGELELVNECTGTVAGDDATEIPARDANGTFVLQTSNIGDLDDDRVAAQPCEAGAVTSKRGAIAGGGSAAAAPDAGAALSSAAATAMSHDGRRIFFASPDPAIAVPNVLAGGDGQTQGCAGLSGVSPPFVEHVGPDSECTPQLYVRQYDSAGEPTVRWISRPAVADQVPGLLEGAVFEGASRDGRTVYFKTRSPLTADDPNGGAQVPGGVTTGSASGNSWDLYRYQLPASLDADPDQGTLTRISGGPTGDADPNTNAAAFGSGAAARHVSDDGRRVYFVTAAPIPGAANGRPDGGITDPSGTVSNSASRNLYLYDDAKAGSGRWKFVAQMPFSTAVDAPNACATYNTLVGPSLIFKNSDTGIGGANVRRARHSCVHGSSNGSSIVFETLGRLTDDDVDEAVDIYRYDAVGDELTRVSAPPAGATPYLCGFALSVVCNADLGSFSAGVSVADRHGLGGHRHTNVSDDGSVFFESRLPLTASDQDDHFDVYEWREGELHLLSPGDTAGPSFYSGNSEDGEDVFVQTSLRIDPREIDDADFDIYDVRRGGGFPAPEPPPGVCDARADGCQGAGSPAPAPADTETDRANGGNAELGDRITLTVATPALATRRRVARSGVLTLRVRGGGPGVVRAIAHARLGGKRRAVGRGRGRLRGAGAASVRLRLSPAARHRLRAGKSLRLAVEVRLAGARAQTMTLRLPGVSR